MNYLQLVNRARLEAGTAAAAFITLAGQTSMEAQRFISWVQDAWNVVQTAQTEWQFMRPTAAFTTINNKPNYTVLDQGLGPSSATPLKEHVKKSFRCWVTSQGVGSEQFLSFMNWDEYRNMYQYANMRQTASRPVVFSVAPDKSIWFGPMPDSASSNTVSTMTLTATGSLTPGTGITGSISGAVGVVSSITGSVVSYIPTSGTFVVNDVISAAGVAQGTINSVGTTADSYTVQFEMWQSPQQLSLDADTPSLPSYFHMIIVWKALQYYAGFESAPEVMDRAQTEYTDLYDKLIVEQLPTLISGPPLATDD